MIAGVRRFMTILFVALTVLSLAGFSLALFLSLARLLRRHHDLELLMLSAGLGPVVLAVVLGYLMKFIPGLHPLIYVALIAVVGSLLALVGWRERGRCAVLQTQFADAARFVVQAGRRRDWAVVVPVLIVGAGVFFALILAMVLPLTANDPLEYASIARLIVERSDSGVYPVIEPDPKHGHYLPFAHPPTYPLLIAWTFLLQGGHTTNDVAVRLLTTWHTIALLGLVACALRAGPRERGVLAMLVYIATPAAIAVIITNHIDPMRLFCMFAAFLAAAWLLQNEDWRYALLFGITIAASMSTHCMGVLALLMAPPIYLVLSRASLKDRIIRAAIVGVVALALAGWHYWLNYRLFGSPIKNALPMWQLPGLAYDQYLDYSRGTITDVDRFVFGFLMGFTRLSSFGFSYWLLLFAVLAGRRMFKERDQPLPRVLGLAVLGFYVIMLVLYLAGSRFASMNDRYQLTMQPMVTCLCAWGLLSAWMPQLTPQRNPQHAA